SLQCAVDMLDTASDWISRVFDEGEEPNNALGQYLMNALSPTPKVDAEEIERDFNTHIQDVLMVAYLANAIRTQIELSQRLATSSITSMSGEGEGKGEGEKDGQRGGGRGGKRGVRGGGRAGQNREPRE